MQSPCSHPGEASGWGDRDWPHHPETLRDPLPGAINNAELLHDNLWHNHPQRRWSVYSPSRHQVLPFIYTHLVSALSTFYLMVTAFLIGLYFEPGEPAVFFICLSLIGLFVAILSTFGLLEVGSTILDPFGEDRNCGDFSNWSTAQSFFVAGGGPTNDPHQLDGDNDGIACESLSGAP